MALSSTMSRWLLTKVKRSSPGAMPVWSKVTLSAHLCVTYFTTGFMKRIWKSSVLFTPMKAVRMMKLRTPCGSQGTSPFSMRLNWRSWSNSSTTCFISSSL